MARPRRREVTPEPARDVQMGAAQKKAPEPGNRAVMVPDELPRIMGIG